ncbi:hypothetical protein FGM00_13505 [Aggregatimonas sangjinii]|uniref:Uncharacterized protein n=1 Tax=Aggregatimonas sangjinii TaxID=2583587 RepID=A0A5B7SVW0_9FLAO|nr:hypothetical protein [Aggregatimonas sangjinii]QCX01081.1 hypothetical protein FGM00_13505 [Aggregatimonas sangjinii]
MKKNLRIYIIFFITFGLSSIQAQDSNKPNEDTSSFAGTKKTDPYFTVRFGDIIRKSPPRKITNTVGSPYLNKKFIKSKVFYDNEPVGDLFVRYNALYSELEVRRTLKDDSTLTLKADKKISVKYGAKELRFTTYINKKNETKNGYLSLISDGNNYKLFHKLSIKYVEGKAAANSMVNDVPSRYAHFDEFYYKQEGIDRIDQLSPRKGRLINQLKKEHKEIAKNFIKENSIDLDKEEDLITLFDFLNTLSRSKEVLNK